MTSAFRHSGLPILLSSRILSRPAEITVAEIAFITHIIEDTIAVNTSAAAAGIAVTGVYTAAATAAAPINTHNVVIGNAVTVIVETVAKFFNRTDIALTT